MSIAALDKRLKKIEKKDIYYIATLADYVIWQAWRKRGDPRTPNEDSIVWDPKFKQHMEESLLKIRAKKRDSSRD